LINANFGHDAGDATRIEIGHRLLRRVRECDVVSRIGGDEFVILLPETSDEVSIDAICRRISGSAGRTGGISRASSAYERQHRSGSVSGPCRDLAGIYKAADIAVYHAKRAGRRTWQRYVPEVSTEPRI